MFPRWLPLYLLGIAALTLFPFEPSLCPRPGWVIRIGPVDFAANFLAFLPIGLALHRFRFGRTVLLVFALSLAIALSHFAFPPRRRRRRTSCDLDRLHAESKL